jgi:hypothetical protein
MMKFEEPQDITIEQFENPPSVEKSHPTPDKVISFTVTELEITSAYTIESNSGTRSDTFVSPVLSLTTADGSSYTDISGFPCVEDFSGPEYTVYTYDRGTSVNGPSIQIKEHSCIGFSIEGKINSFGSKEKRMVLYQMSSEGYLNKYPLGSTECICLNTETRNVEYSNIDSFMDSIAESPQRESGSMDVTTGSETTVSNVYQVVPHLSEGWDSTFVLRGKNGNELYTTNKIKDVVNKRYTAYIERDDRRTIIPTVIGFSWDETNESVIIAYVKDSGSVSVKTRISEGAETKIYDHINQREITENQIRMLNELEGTNTIPRLDTNQKLRTAVKELSYTDEEFMLFLRELDNEEGALSADSFDQDYQSLIDADEHFRFIVQYLIEYNTASFLRITGDLLDDEISETLQDISIDGDSQPVTKQIRTEVCI